MAKISAVIIAKNEEKKIRRCLDSLKGFADEIIVVDDLSTDSTAQICREYGAKVIRSESMGNFDKQRNVGINVATNDWVLQMDADEVIPRESVPKIEKALSEPGKYSAFSLKRRNFLFGHPLSYGGSYNEMVKLFKKGKGTYVGEIHEKLQLDGEKTAIDAEVLHYPLDSIRGIIERWNYYTDKESESFLRETKEICYKDIKYRLTWKALKLFWKLYFKKQGYKDGIYGLVWCILNVIEPEIRWLKILEKGINEGRL